MAYHPWHAKDGPRIIREREAAMREASRPKPLPLPQRRQETGHVFVFGSGDAGQLGLGEDVLVRERPMPLTALNDMEVVDVASGGMHSIALTIRGQLWSWGCNDEGALGRVGDEDQYYVPGLVEQLEDVDIVKVACGDSISLALSAEGKVYCWGTFRCAQGRLGFAPGIPSRPLAELYELLQNQTIIDIAAGADHCLALTERGLVYAWGNSQQRQSGRRVSPRHMQNGLVPEVLRVPLAKKIGAGSYHSFAVTRDNKLYVWGLNNHGQCGFPPMHPNTVIVPTLIQELEGQGVIEDVVGGEHHTLVLMNDGRVFSFGRADLSQLGVWRNTIGGAPEIGHPQLITSVQNVVQISTCSNHNITTDHLGVAHTWGFGETYALGTGSEEDAEVPVMLTGQKLQGHRVLRVAAGAQHSVILARQ